MMDTEINNEHKFIRSTSNLGSPTISKQYRPSKVENEQLLITSFNFPSIENDMLQNLKIKWTIYHVNMERQLKAKNKIIALSIVFNKMIIMLETWSKECWKEHKVETCQKEMWVEGIVGENIIKIIEDDDKMK